MPATAFDYSPGPSTEHTTPRPFTSPRPDYPPGPSSLPLLVSLSQSAFGFGFAGDLSSSKMSFAFSTTLYASRDESDVAPRAFTAVGLAADSVFAVASAVGTAAGFASSAVGAACVVAS